MKTKYKSIPKVSQNQHMQQNYAVNAAGAMDNGTLSDTTFMTKYKPFNKRRDARRKT
jgi:hypothetical protein